MTVRELMTALESLDYNLIVKQRVASTGATTGSIRIRIEDGLVFIETP